MQAKNHVFAHPKKCYYPDTLSAVSYNPTYRSTKIWSGAARKIPQSLSDGHTAYVIARHSKRARRLAYEET